MQKIICDVCGKVSDISEINYKRIIKNVYFYYCDKCRKRYIDLKKKNNGEFREIELKFIKARLEVLIKAIRELEDRL